MKAAKYTVAAILLLAAFIGGAVTILAIIDPAAAKLADDSDPFGVPPSRLISSMMLLGFVFLGGLGVYILRKRQPASN